ncbi:hypothetical protein [Paraburkholderia sp. RL17-381-BIF-C]|uniref:hypothetical protein n=1 Tax=Paraburkholderia sp. RL17-381-BIF-C TaxID=3031635 RepID=UPI0038BB43C7
MSSIQSLNEKAVAATFAMAILVIVTLTAVPLGQLDAPLQHAVRLFCWSAVLLGCVLILSVAVVPEVTPHTPLSLYRMLFRQALFSCGGLAWLLGAWQILAHFRIPSIEVTGMLGVLTLSIYTATTTVNYHYEVRLAQQKRSAEAEPKPHVKEEA